MEDQWNENMLQPHNETVHPGTALDLSIAALLVAILIMVPAPKNPCAISFLVSMMLFTTYSGLLLQRDRQDYHGLMRITGVRHELRTERVSSSSNDDSSSYRKFYEALLEVEWGYDWACPDHGGVVCKSTVIPCTERVCSDRVCSARRTEAAFQRIKACSLQYFDETIDYTPVTNKTLGPSTDDFWPHVTAFGNCDACTSNIRIASPKALVGVRIAGFAFLGITLFMAIVIGVMVLLT